eukprot:Gb_27386 [translate_table: standard]
MKKNSRIRIRCHLETCYWPEEEGVRGSPTVSQFPLSNMGTDSNIRVFTLSEVSQHNSEKDCWLIIDGKVFGASTIYLMITVRNMLAPTVSGHNRGKPRLSFTSVSRLFELNSEPDDQRKFLAQLLAHRPEVLTFDSNAAKGGKKSVGFNDLVDVHCNLQSSSVTVAEDSTGLGWQNPVEDSTCTAQMVTCPFARNVTLLTSLSNME